VIQGKKMKVQMNILRISAGTMTDAKSGEKIVYASAIILDENVADEISIDRIDVGQQHAKVKMCFDQDNVLARSLATSGLVPGLVDVEVKTAVKGGSVTMEIIGFSPRKAA
jgi:hypothetical protein